MTSREPVRECAHGRAAGARRSKITPEREQEFYDAVLDQLRECGYEAVTMEGVATATRCSKSTLYRQWKTKPQFVAAALRANRCVRFAGIDTGSVAGDLRAAARAAAAWSERDTMLVQALSHAVQQDEDLRRALREALVEPEVQAVDAILRRGVERGELPADHPAREFVAAQLFGVLRVRPMLEGRNADAEYLTRFVDAVLLPVLGVADDGAGSVVSAGSVAPTESVASAGSATCGLSVGAADASGCVESAEAGPGVVAYGGPDRADGGSGAGAGRAVARGRVVAQGSLAD